jgi:VanZ family protein
LSDKGGLTRYLPRWLLFVTWGVSILWLSLTPSPPVLGTGLLAWDKFQHAASFGLLTLLGYHAFVRFSSLRQRLICAAAVSVFFGVLVEVAQGLLTTARTAEAGDLAADIVGVAAACAVVVCGRQSHKS